MRISTTSGSLRVTMTIGFFALVGMGVPLLPWLDGSETLWGRRVWCPI
jgi:hypothetical protein